MSCLPSEGVGLHVLVLESLEGGVAGRRRKRIATERRERRDLDRVHDLGAGDDTGERGAVADPLGEGEHVGNDVVGLVPPEVFAGAPPAGLDLVGDQQDAGASSSFWKAPKKPSGGVANPPTP